MDMRRIKAIERDSKRRILDANPCVPEESGIYFLTREEDGIRYAYVGQARNLLSRLAQHLTGHQHIDLSLKKRGLYSRENPDGWSVRFVRVLVSDLDEEERSYIKIMADKGYQLYNHTTGGQDKGKAALGEAKTPKGYYDGVKQGYKNAQKFVANLFAKHLDYSVKKQTQWSADAVKKFEAFLTLEEDDGEKQ